MYSSATTFSFLVPGVKKYTIHLNHEDGLGELQWAHVTKRSSEASYNTVATYVG